MLKITAKIVLTIRQNYYSLLPIFLSAFEIFNFPAQYGYFHKIDISMKLLTLFQASPVCQWTWNAWTSCRNNYQTRTVRITRYGTNCPRVRTQRQRCVRVWFYKHFPDSNKTQPIILSPINNFVFFFSFFEKYTFFISGIIKDVPIYFSSKNGFCLRI